MEVAALRRELGELHYWERPSDPIWYERHVEPVVSPLAEQSAAQLAATPPSCVPHLPYLPHPWPRSPRPFHVASPVGTPDAARLLSDGHSPVTAQAPTGDAGLEGGGGAMFMDGWADDADWAPLAEGIAEAVSEAVSDGFSEYAHASMLDDLSGVRARQGGLGVRRAVGLQPTLRPASRANSPSIGHTGLGHRFAQLASDVAAGATFLRTEPDCRGLAGFYSWSTKLGRP